jgi:hypothetical protein
MIKRVLIRQLVKNAVGGGWGYDQESFDPPIS